MPTEIWAAIVGVVGTLLGVWYGSRVSSNTARHLVVQQAKAEFSSVFTETLVQLHAPVNEEGRGEALEILQNNFPAHLTAYLKLKAALPSSYSPGLEAAWSRYTKDGEYELKEEKEFYRFAHVLNGKNDEQMQALAIKHVNALIKSVKET